MSMFGMNQFSGGFNQFGNGQIGGGQAFFGLPIGPSGGFNSFGGFGPVNPTFQAFNQLGGIGGFPAQGPFFNAFGPTNNPFPYILSNWTGQPSSPGPVTFPSPLLGAFSLFPASSPDMVNILLGLTGASGVNIAGTGLVPPSLFNGFGGGSVIGGGAGPFGSISGLF
ncbi:MAG: hypothetical protein QE263_09305 [Vampirovibrionales bacterium]|nr:hypothetical protein [Vampirovibrionales bacterium]